MKRDQAKLVFLLPAVLWVLAFTVFPLAYSAGVSFAKQDSSVEVTREKVAILDDAGNPVLSRTGNPRTRTLTTKKAITDWTYIGGQNYSRLVKDQQTGAAVKFTLTFAVVGVTLQIVVGMALAVLFNRKLRGRTLMRTLMLLPIFATPIAVGNVFRTIYFEEGGPLSPLKFPFMQDAVTIPWLSDPSWAFSRSSSLTFGNTRRSRSWCSWPGCRGSIRNSWRRRRWRRNRSARSSSTSCCH